MVPYLGPPNALNPRLEVRPDVLGADVDSLDAGPGLAPASSAVKDSSPPDTRSSPALGRVRWGQGLGRCCFLRTCRGHREFGRFHNQGMVALESAYG